ncbi:uncharacterized protein LOC121272528 [Carcharodon carcharias]|uniref:uncharacterized protein LOC121272528 n=1 Tax=Carcharodon carcharias TaxID=13397 RepID=UPI001B7F54DF|nr:uncharacterized protein LOC121272528 [Carcharodon carcharias]
MSIAAQSDRTSVAPVQQWMGPVVNTLLKTKRKAADDTSRSPKVTPGKRKSLTESPAENDPESPPEDHSPGAPTSNSAVCCSDEGIGSPSAFLDPSPEGAIVSAGGSNTPLPSTVMRRGSWRAACEQTQRVLPKTEASPWHWGHRTGIRKSLQCFALNRGKDSKLTPPFNLMSKGVRATCCDLPTSTVAGILDRSTLAGKDALLTPVPHKSGPLVSGFINKSESEGYASHHLSSQLEFNISSDAELSKSKGALLQDSLGLLISSLDPVFDAKKPQQPRVAGTPGSKVAECDQAWRGHDGIFKLDLGFSVGSDISTPYFLQGPHCSSVPDGKVIRRSLSLPEAISESNGIGSAKGDVEARFVEDLDVYQKTQDGDNDALPVENSRNFNGEHKMQSVPSVEARHPSTKEEDSSRGRNRNSEMTQGLPRPFIVLTEEDYGENCVLHSVCDAGDRFRSAEKRTLGSCDSVTYTSGKPSPQPSIMELARVSVTECIRKLNKLSAKRPSAKHSFSKVPLSSEQTPHQSSVFRFTQHASTLFGKKSVGGKHQGAKPPMRRSLSLESACKNLKGLEDDCALSHDKSDSYLPETNNPDGSGVSEQHLSGNTKSSTLYSPQRKMSRPSPVRRPVLEESRKQTSPDRSGTGVRPH